MTWLCKQTFENRQNHSACHGRVPGLGNAGSRKGGAERHQEATGKEELGRGAGGPGPELPHQTMAFRGLPK